MAPPEEIRSETPSSGPSYDYAAFISYRHVDPDRKWAKWLHTRLETYRVPKQLIAGGAPKRLGRVFRDEEELAASADLSQEIDSALERSRFLIVICSPRTPVSKWVNQEIVRFRELGRHDQILAVLIEGEPQDAFPIALSEIRSDVTRRSGLSREKIEEVEPLAADVRAVAGESERIAKRFALLKIAAALLGRRFDELRQRDQERKIRTQLQISLILGALVIAAGLLTTFAFYQKRAADHQRNIAEARMLLSQGEAEFEAHPLVGLRVAAEGLARVPAGEAELTASLSKRVAAMAARGRVMKVGSDVRDVYHRLPEFPYVLVQSRYSDSRLFRAQDLGLVAEVAGLAVQDPLKVTSSLKHFALSKGGPDPIHTIRRSVDGRSLGTTERLSQTTLIPNGDPLYMRRDVGFSPLLRRLDSDLRLGRPGFDLRTMEYTEGARAFALFYRDDENTRLPPPPDLIDLVSGEVIETLPKATSAVFFDNSGSPYYVLVVGDADWQLRRVDMPGEVVFGSAGSPGVVSFGKDASAGLLLIGLSEFVEIRRLHDGGLVGSTGVRVKRASPRGSRVSWTVRLWPDSEERVLSLVDDELRLHAAPGDQTETEPEMPFIPVAAAALPSGSSGVRGTGRLKAFGEGIHRLTQEDESVRRRVWRQGQKGRRIHFEDRRVGGLESLYVRAFYDDRDMDDENLIYSELRRTADDSIVLGSSDKIRSMSADPSREFLWLRLVEPDDDDESKLLVLRLADGKTMWDGYGERVSFVPYGSHGYFFVWTGSDKDRLHGIADGRQIASLGGALRDIDFRTLAREGFFVVSFSDGRRELWDGNGPPRRLRSLGFGLGGYLRLPNKLMLIWYDNGNAYVIDPSWLASIDGGLSEKALPDLLVQLCDGLFAKPWFDRRAWGERQGFETKTCL